MQELNDFRRDREQTNAVRMKPLIASPAVGAFVMPAGAMVFFKSVAGCAAGTTAATYTTSSGAKLVKTPALASGAAMNGIYIERGVTVTPSNGFDVMIDTGLGRRRKIAGGA